MAALLPSRVASAHSLGELEERRQLKYAKRVVIKVGTPVITNAEGAIAVSRISSLVEQVVQLVSSGKEVVLVTSGAIGHGLLRMNAQAVLSGSLRDVLAGRSDKPMDLKAAAAVGQSGLMSLYDLLFREHNRTCAQILATLEDWDTPRSLSQLRETTAELLSIGAVPIVNENDAVSERPVPVIGPKNLVIWDNDTLASRLAGALHADVLLVLVDMDRVHRVLPDGTPSPMTLYKHCSELWHTDELDRPVSVRMDADGKLVALARTTNDGTSEGYERPYRSRIAAEGLPLLVGSACEATRSVRRPDPAPRAVRWGRQAHTRGAGARCRACVLPSSPTASRTASSRAPSTAMTLAPSSSASNECAHLGQDALATSPP